MELLLGLLLLFILLPEEVVVVAGSLDRVRERALRLDLSEFQLAEFYFLVEAIFENFRNSKKSTIKRKLVVKKLILLC